MVGVLGAALPLVMILGLFRVILGGHRLHAFNNRLGRLEMRSLSGSNAASVLAVLTIAHLTQAATQAVDPDSLHRITPALTIGAVALLVGLAVTPTFTRSILALAGVAAFLTDLALTQGPASAATYIAITVACWLGFAVLRGLLG